MKILQDMGVINDNTKFTPKGVQKNQGDINDTQNDFYRFPLFISPNSGFTRSIQIKLCG